MLSLISIADSTNDVTKPQGAVLVRRTGAASQTSIPIADSADDVAKSQWAVGIRSAATGCKVGRLRLRSGGCKGQPAKASDKGEIDCDHGNGCKDVSLVVSG